MNLVTQANINTIKKYATRFAKDSASRILKLMDGNINYLKEMSKEERDILNSEWKKESGDSEIEFGVTTSEILNTFENYQKVTLCHEYKIEEHCIRFTNFVDTCLKDFEIDIEAQSL